MKVRATTIGFYEAMGDPLVSCRLEIMWEDNSSWLDAGLMHKTVWDWMFWVYVVMLGCREAGIEFIYESYEEKNRAIPKELV